MTFSGTPAELSPVIRGNSISGSYRGVDFVLNDGFEGIASPVIADNQITGSTYQDLFLEYDIYNGHGATMTPLVSGNTLSGSCRIRHRPEPQLRFVFLQFGCGDFLADDPQQ